MPRMARVILAHYPHHIVQRGHNRQVTFAERADFERYVATLREFKDEYGVLVYAFCLMTNHVHLLLAPREPNGIGKLMKRLAARQTRHHNRPRFLLALRSLRINTLDGEGNVTQPVRYFVTNNVATSAAVTIRMPWYFLRSSKCRSPETMISAFAASAQAST